MGKVFFEGVYFSGKPASELLTESMKGASFFRFYENGTVLSVTTTATINQLKNWFNEEGDCDRGKFTINGNTISFQIVSKDPFGADIGTIDYIGVIKNDTLIININGYEKKTEYLFSTWWQKLYWV